MPATALPATDIGVASAVLPQATGTPPDTEMRVLNVGIDIFADERVQTGERGRTQLLFLDGSALTIGPNSDVTLDEFVYDPETKTGKLAFSATKGVLRLVGGRISKRTPVLVRTPTATIGIRGGIALMNIGAQLARSTFLFGDEMTVSAEDVTQRVTRPGFQIEAPLGVPPNPPVPASEQQLSADMGGFEGSEGQDSGVEVGDSDVAASQVSELASGAGPGIDLPPPDTGGTQTAESGAEVSFASQQIAQDEIVEFVDGTPTVPGGGGGGGSGSGCTGLCLNGFVGRAKLGDTTLVGTNDGNAANNLALTDVTIGNGRLTAGGYSLFFPSAAGEFMVGGANLPAQTPFGSVTGMGTLLPDNDFVYYRLTGSRQILFAGLPNNTVPTSGSDAFDLTRDFPRDSEIPFIDLPQGSASLTEHGRVFINWDNSQSGSAVRAFGGGAFVISGMGPAQVSGASVFAGEVLLDGAGRPFITAAHSGQSRLGGDSILNEYSSPVASADAGDGSDLFGLNSINAFVLEAAGVNGQDQIVTRGGTFEDTAGMQSTIFPGAAATRVDSVAVGTTAPGNMLQGFLGGVGEFLSVSIINDIEAFNGTTGSPNDVQINRNPATNTFTAMLNMEASGSDDDVLVSFGPGNAAFIAPGAMYGVTSTVSVNSGSNDTGEYYFGSSNILHAQNFLPSGVNFCGCLFLEWGFFGGSRTDIDGSSASQEQDIALASWVAGRLANDAQVTTMAGSFSYTGHVIASFVLNQSDIYHAAGNIQLDFTFNAGNFTLDDVNITSLDGTTYATTPFSPTSFNTNLYNSGTAGLAITGTHPVVGNVTATLKGAFYGTDTPPQETAGQIDISGSNYQGGGTYAAKR